jgi:hypothetical protein
MTPLLPGISGSLLPSRFLADGIGDERPGHLAAGSERHRRLRLWWSRVESRCGPASGIRQIFDVAAMPLCAELGFRARAVEFAPDAATVRLETAQGTPVALVVLSWASRPAARWKATAETARAFGADWAVILAPPFLSVLDVRAHATRRSVDFAMPEALDGRSIDRFLLITHAEAFDGSGRFGPSRQHSLIDRLVTSAGAYRDRVRADLQGGVLEALAALVPAITYAGRGRSAEDFNQALTLVYRMLFLLFAESRDLVPQRHPLYGAAYSVSELCREALTHADRGVGLWDALAAITRLSRVGCRVDDLIVAPFNGRLFARASAPSLEARQEHRVGGRGAGSRDAALARALTAVGTRPGPGGREEIAYADLGVEQLGAVYERVLDLDPSDVATHGAPLENVGRGFSPGFSPTRQGRRASRQRHSRQRKQTGTFYTPQPLAEFVVRRTLAPLVRGVSSDAILRLRVVDPAMGSGAFLVAACRFLAAAYDRALVDEGRCGEADLDDRARARHRRLIAERCLAGVDCNPVAVQLARLSIWLMTLAHGKPLGFLDHQLRTGNSLVGASPDDLWRTAAESARPREPGRLLFDTLDIEGTMRQAAAPFRELIARPDDSLGDIRAKEGLWRRFAGAGSPLESWRLACSLWCACFFWADACGDGNPRCPPPSPSECRAAIDAIVRGDSTLAAAHVRRLADAASRAAAAQRFFHWPLEFPDVFYDGAGAARADAGFDAVIGNPPWEMLRRDNGDDHDEAGDGDDGIAADATDRSRRDLIGFIRGSGFYPSCGRGHVNLYQPFLERALALVRPGGRVGLILPWGVATDDGAGALRRRIVDRCGHVTILGLDNAAALFPIHRGLRIAAIALTREASSGAVRLRTGVRTIADIESLPDVDDPAAASPHFLSIEAETLRDVGGTARRIPDLRRRGDLDWLRRIAAAYPALGAADGWRARFGRELNATEDRSAFGPTGLAVIGGRHLSPFAIRSDASSPRIDAEAAARLLPDRRYLTRRLAYRDVSGVGNRLSLIAAVVPAGVVTTHTVFCLRSTLPLRRQLFLCGLFNSFVLNAVVRLLMGTHVTTSLVEGLPVPRWSGAPPQRRIARLAAALARRPDDQRQHALIQAAIARLYGFDPETFAGVLDAFPLVPTVEREAALDALRQPA